MIQKALNDLEFDAILELLRALASTPIGATQAATLGPAVEADEVSLEQALTIEATRYLEAHGALPFGTLTDPEPALMHLTVEASVCTPGAILELLRLMKSSRDVKSVLALVRTEHPRLWGVARDLPDLGSLIRFLDGKIGPQGEVLDHASDDLLALRRDIRRAGERLEGLLEAIVSRPDVAKALQDDFVALRSERHVIPIRSESQKSVAGIVHGVSGSGATVFVEPLETVELNNEIVTLREREAAEVRRLLREYSELLRGRLAELRLLTGVLGRLDLVVARARLGQAMQAQPAHIDAEGGIRLQDARHPLVEASLKGQGAAIVPLNLALSPGESVLMISGPNTGGKTVALKTLGLLALMHQSGLFVPASRASLPLFRSVFIDIGDRQSIQDRLSTFSARIGAIASMAREVVFPSLILLDEVGTGTDPEEGVALAIAIIDYFRKRGARVIATTHLEALKAYAASTPACSNAAMQFDETTGEPTYRLVQGIPGRSSALEIAARLGLPEPILEDARARRGESKRMLDDYLGRLETLTADLEARVRDADRRQERLDADRRAMEQELRQREERQRQAVSQEIELAVGSIRAEGERYLATLKEREIELRMRREETKQAARLRAEARRRLRAVAPGARELQEADRALVPGTRVIVRGLGLPGTVQSVQGARVAILARGKRVVVPRDDCEAVQDGGLAPQAAGAPLPPGVTLRRRDATAADEIDLRGFPIEDALSRLDKFLDDAVLESLGRVRLVHGVGSGRLRKAVHNLLGRHPQVESFSGAADNEGGSGATIVTLRS
ncbi:MAG TPA: endonuclease MutS2 [Candidatus Cryosericum sp.]|nr:endonuclease MutS2 [Candidatus Cryosericum sp.]